MPSKEKTFLTLFFGILTGLQTAMAASLRASAEAAREVGVGLFNGHGITTHCNETEIISGHGDNCGSGAHHIPTIAIVFFVIGGVCGLCTIYKCCSESSSDSSGDDYTFTSPNYY